MQIGGIEDVLLFTGHVSHISHITMPLKIEVRFTFFSHRKKGDSKSHSHKVKQHKKKVVQ
jgi:hypothetical protein